ncbi:uncharacterized protein LOC108669969 [Hyalella azteca]|uniref:Uncharacterized protein LOC108669969 n=2 Tax=Hyalella azteca TaxID=294128 RepID=A0A979FU66_HYAAZ|nr:uncharacterized protein LOC108669969 [Hyalella azteca]
MNEEGSLPIESGSNIASDDNIPLCTTLTIYHIPSNNNISCSTISESVSAKSIYQGNSPSRLTFQESENVNKPKYSSPKCLNQNIEGKSESSTQYPLNQSGPSKSGLWRYSSNLVNEKQNFSSENRNEIFAHPVRCKLNPETYPMSKSFPKSMENPETYPMSKSFPKSMENCTMEDTTIFDDLFEQQGMCDTIGIVLEPHEEAGAHALKAGLCDPKCLTSGIYKSDNICVQTQATVESTNICVHHQATDGSSNFVQRSQEHKISEPDHPETWNTIIGNEKPASEEVSDFQLGKLKSTFNVITTDTSASDEVHAPHENDLKNGDVPLRNATLLNLLPGENPSIGATRRSTKSNLKVTENLQINEQNEANIALEPYCNAGAIYPKNVALDSEKSIRKEQLAHHVSKYPFKCSVCAFETGQKRLFNAHCKTHLPEKPFTCALCPFRSKYKCSLIQHCSLKHDPTNRRKNTEIKLLYNCTMCEFSSTHVSSWRRHRRKHSTIAHQTDLHDSKKTFQSSLMSQIQCKINSSLKPLTREKMMNMDNSKENISFDKSVVYLNNPNNEKNLKINERLLQGVPDDVVRSSEEQLIVDQTKVDKRYVRLYRCRYCPLVFHDSISRRHHMPVHRKEMRYGCTICGYRTNSPSVLKHHIRRHLASPFYASILSKDLRSNNDLKSDALKVEVESQLSYEAVDEREEPGKFSSLLAVGDFGACRVTKTRLKTLVNHRCSDTNFINNSVIKTIVDDGSNCSQNKVRHPETALNCQNMKEECRTTKSATAIDANINYIRHVTGNSSDDKIRSNNRQITVPKQCSKSSEQAFNRQSIFSEIENEEESKTRVKIKMIINEADSSNVIPTEDDHVISINNDLENTIYIDEAKSDIISHEVGNMESSEVENHSNRAEISSCKIENYSSSVKNHRNRVENHSNSVDNNDNSVENNSNNADNNCNSVENDSSSAENNSNSAENNRNSAENNSNSAENNSNSAENNSNSAENNSSKVEAINNSVANSNDIKIETNAGVPCSKTIPNLPEDLLYYTDIAGSDASLQGARPSPRGAGVSPRGAGVSPRGAGVSPRGAGVGCQLCDFRCAGRSTLVKHRLACHPQLSGMRCKVCSACFPSRRQLHRHQAALHAAALPHRCPICGYRTTLRYLLQRHMRCHTKQMFQYSCTKCSFSSRAKSAIVLHARSHSGSPSYVALLQGDEGDDEGAEVTFELRAFEAREAGL